MMMDEKYVNGSYEERIERIKAIACRGGKKEDFNKLDVTRLRTIYNTFRVINKTTKQTIETAYECIN